MSGRVFSSVAFALAASVISARGAWAQQATPPQDSAQVVREEVARLRAEFDQVRQQYGTRLADLEQRLAALEGKPAAVRPAAAAETPAQPAPPTEAAAAAAAPPPVEVPVPARAASAGGPEGALPVYGNISAMSKVFNPDMAVIGNFLGAAGKNDIEPSSGLQMSEAETSFQAIVDPYAKADFFLTFGPEGAGIEEGYLTLTSLPGALLMKVGKMRSAFGKVNQMHSHVLPWTDRPLVTRSLVGGEDGISDSGISVSKLILNPLFFLEATGEVYGGGSNVFAAPTRGDLTYVGHLRGYRDITEGTNLDLGTSVA